MAGGHRDLDLNRNLRLVSPQNIPVRIDRTKDVTVQNELTQSG